MVDKEHTLPKRKTGRLIGGWALIVVAVLGGWYNLTTNATSSGDLLRDTLNQAGRSSDSVGTVIAMIAFIAWGVHLIRTASK